MTAKELPPGDWRRVVYGRSRISGIGQRRKPSAADRERIIARQGYKCLYCDIPISTKIWRHSGARAREVMLIANWDHFVPFAYSQQNPSANWILACHVCNGIKTARMLPTVEAARQVILPERIAKGYEEPEAVFHRLGLERDGIVIAHVPRPSEKQIEALALAAQGLTVRQIAAALGISPGSTVKRLDGAMRRVGAGSTEEAAQIAKRHGFISRPEIPSQTESEAS